MTKTALFSLVVTATLAAAGCGAQDLEVADDDLAVPTEIIPSGDDVVAQSITPDRAVEDALDQQDALSDTGFEDLFGFSRTAQRCQAMRLAIGQAGIAESPLGSNSGAPLTRYVRWFYPSQGAVPWCAAFVSWTIDQTDNKNRRTPWTNPLYVGSVRDWGARQGRLVSRPAPCDIVGWGDHHIGWVTGVSGNTIRTVEGNHSDRVASGAYAISREMWFLRY